MTARLDNTQPILSRYYGMIFTLSLMVFSLFAAIDSAQAASNPRYASIVMDADSGMILSERYADKKLHPASLAKIMTLVLTFDALEKHKLRLTDRIYISQHAANMVPSKLDLPVGSYIRVEDAIYALVTKSANDVAVALAEKIAGSESRFASLMTIRAREIGMSSTTFRNASGLHDPRQVTTARDMALLARYVIQTYPQHYDYFSTASFTYQGKTYKNHNKLMASYKGMDGFKTGYIAAAGFNLVASAVRNDRRIIGVVFGGRSGQTRNSHMKYLLDRGFSELNTVIMASLKAPIPQRKPVIGTQLAMVDAGSQTPLQALEGSLNSEHTEVTLPPETINALLQNPRFREMIGEGDYDPVIFKRLETGMVAIDALRSKKEKASKDAGWSIQVGAFYTDEKARKIAEVAMNRLPDPLKKGSVHVLPLQTYKGQIYRSRLTGFSKDEAEQACQHFNSCLVVSAASARNILASR